MNSEAEDRSESSYGGHVFFPSKTSYSMMRLRATGSMCTLFIHILSHPWWSVCQRHTVTTWRVTVHHIYPLCTRCQATAPSNLLSFALWGSKNIQAIVCHVTCEAAGFWRGATCRAAFDKWHFYSLWFHLKNDVIAASVCAHMYANSARSLCN